MEPPSSLSVRVQEEARIGEEQCLARFAMWFKNTAGLAVSPRTRAERSPLTGCQLLAGFITPFACIMRHSCRSTITLGSVAEWASRLSGAKSFSEDATALWSLRVHHAWLVKASLR